MKLTQIFSLVATVSTLALGTVSLAAEHPVGTIQGNQINLQTYDHAIAGSIKDFLMWGFVNEETFSSDIIMRKDEQIIKATFAKLEDGRTGGVIAHTVENREILTSVFLTKVDAAARQILLNINGQDVAISIEGTYENGHFINPTYTGVYNGETIQFQMAGEACFGFSFHLVAMIFGAYIH